MFEHRVTARFYEVDRAGVLFFSRIFEYCHAALEALMAELFPGEMDRVFGGGAYAMPVVHAGADFRRPIRLGDVLAVRVRAERGGRSVRFFYTVVGEGGEVRAEVTMVHTFVDTQTFEGIAPAPEMLEALRRRGVLEE